MLSKSKPVSPAERTEILPAQEKVACGEETVLLLSAEQVYAQRSAELRPIPEDHQSQGFIP